MQEYKVKVTINKEEFETLATYDLEKEYLYYIENDSNKTVNIFDYKNNILKRDNNEMYLELSFDINKVTKNTLTLKELNKTIELELTTKDILINEKGIYIKYNLNEEEYIFKIEREVI